MPLKDPHVYARTVMLGTISRGRFRTVPFMRWPFLLPAHLEARTSFLIYV